MDVQTIAVLVIAALAAVWLVRYLLKSFLRRGAVGCGTCHTLTTPKEPTEIEPLPVHPDRP